MAPTPNGPQHYQFLVIGGGSGGVACARRAAAHGAKTLLIEGSRLGGTCVNVGCVPKKVMWNASDLSVRINKHAKAYDLLVDGKPPKAEFDWPAFKAKRDAYVKRLNGIYERNLEKEKVEYVSGWAKFVDNNTVEVSGPEGSRKYTADRILLATGSTAVIPTEPQGAEHGITSDGFFELEKQPKTVAVVGAGYIGVELAGVLHGLGSETHLFIRHDYVLRAFDELIQTNVTDSYIHEGINVHRQFKFPSKIEKIDGGRLRIQYTDKEHSEPTTLEVDSLIWAIGRRPLTDQCGLNNTGVKTDDRGRISVDEYQQTSVKSIFSLGDAAEEVELTPAAIAAGRRLADRLFGNKPDAKLNYENIPSAIFSHPEAGSIGLTEQAAREKFGDKVKVYNSKFINMYYSPFEQNDKQYTAYKIIAVGEEEKIVGLHLFGDSSAEILQGFGVAIKMGATKADFDNCVAIHPTAAEELVTMK